jgi:hypothetical protein
MKLCLLVLLFLLVSCTTPSPRFYKNKVCSNESLKYLRHPQNIRKRMSTHPALLRNLAATSTGMQGCYEELKQRTGIEEFSTCLVVGIDRYGKQEFFNFHSREVELDDKFLTCAQSVTKSIPFEKYGRNYILLQSYQFYVTDL